MRKGGNLFSSNVEVISKTVTVLKTILYEIQLRNKHFKKETVTPLIILDHPKQRMETAASTVCMLVKADLKKQTSG